MKIGRTLLICTLALLTLLASLLLSSCAVTDKIEDKIKDVIGNVTELHRVVFTVEGETHAEISTAGKESLTLPSEPSRAGYRFVGWFTADGKQFTENYLSKKELKSNLTVSARFEPIVYTATFVSLGETVGTTTFTVEDSAISAIAVPSRTGYTGAWDSLAVAPESVTVSAVYTPIRYAIRYDDPMSGINRNPTEYTIESASITLAEPTGVMGYVFLGWYLGDEPVSEIKSGSCGEITLTARWSLRDYVITYENTEGATHSNPLTYRILDTPLTLTDATRPGYRFAGWFLDPELTRSVAALSGYGDRTLYAKWTPIN